MAFGAQVLATDNRIRTQATGADTEVVAAVDTTVEADVEAIALDTKSQKTQQTTWISQQQATSDTRKSNAANNSTYDSLSLPCTNSYKKWGNKTKDGRLLTALLAALGTAFSYYWEVDSDRFQVTFCMQAPDGEDSPPEGPLSKKFHTQIGVCPYADFGRQCPRHCPQQARNAIIAVRDSMLLLC